MLTLEIGHEHSFCRLLYSIKGCRCPPELSAAKILTDLTAQAPEGQLRHQELGGPLVPLDLTESHRYNSISFRSPIVVNYSKALTSWPEAMRLLHISRSLRRLLAPCIRATTTRLRCSRQLSSLARIHCPQSLARCTGSACKCLLSPHSGSIVQSSKYVLLG